VVLPSIHRPSNQEKHSAKKADGTGCRLIYVGGWSGTRGTAFAVRAILASSAVDLGYSEHPDPSKVSPKE
jgi:hypothetical protein